MQASGTGRPTSSGIAVDAELDCVLGEYPCTWAEVSAEALARTQDLSDRAMERFDVGQDAASIAEWLRAEPDVAEVLHDEYAVRFRLREGRPVWLFSPEGAAAGVRGGSGAVPPMLQRGPDKADPVGEQKAGVRPQKALLFLDPYRWDFWMDVVDGAVSVYDDEATRIPVIFDNVRDYKCAPGRQCPCANGDCTRYVGNAWSGGCDPYDASCQVDVNVTLADWKGWKGYDVIHVSSHGTELCTPKDSNNCAAGIASGRLIRDDLKMLADLLATGSGIPPAWAEWLNEPGIELYRLGLAPSHCVSLLPGTPGYSFAQCDTQKAVWREYLGLDFFRAAYRPGDLKDKLIFLNSCVSMRHKVLANYLAGPSSENAIVGWTEYTANGAASRAAGVFYREWVKGKTAHEAFQAVSSDLQYQALGPAFVGGPGIVRGDDPDRPKVAGPTIHETHGLKEKRGVETVYLLDPATDVEVTDGGRIPLFTQPGDGLPDTLDTLIEVVSLDSDEDPSQYVLRVRVDGRDAPETARFNMDLGDGTHRYRGSVDLGFDLAPGQRVDVEVSADLPGGGETRWLYYDMVPDACIVPRQGRVAGHMGGPLSRTIDPARRGEFAKIFRSPMGGWGLQLEGREPGNEADFQFHLADAPVAGARITVFDAGITDFDIAGGVRDPDRVNWLSGNAQIDFTAVLPQAGKPFTWVCGTVSADLVGMKDPPPGSITPIEIPATFRGQFWAEWYPNR